MSRVVIISVILLGFWSGIAVGQDIVLPRPFRFAWPVSNPALDSAEFFYTQVIKKNNVRIKSGYNETNALISQTFYNRGGFMERELFIRNDTLSRETNYTIDSHGQILEIQNVFFSSSKADIVFGNIERYEYKDLKPHRNIVSVMDGIRISEAVYEKGILSQIKIFDKDNLKETGSIDVYRNGDTISIGKEYDGEREYLFLMINRNDSLFYYGIGMWPHTVVFKNQRIIFDGTEYFYKKHFYKDNGLIDFSEVKEQSDSEAKIFYFRYYYYVD